MHRKMALRLYIKLFIYLVFVTSSAKNMALDFAEAESNPAKENQVNSIRNLGSNYDYFQPNALFQAVKTYDKDFLISTADASIPQLNQRQVDLIDCILKRDLDCFLINIEKVPPEEWVYPAGVGKSPFEIALRDFAYEFVKVFLEAGVNPNAVTLSTNIEANSISVESWIALLVHHIHHFKYEGVRRESVRTKTRSRDYSKNPFELKKPSKLREQKEFLGISQSSKFTVEDLFKILDLLLSHGAEINVPSYIIESAKRTSVSAPPKITTCGTAISRAAFHGGMYETIELLLKYDPEFSDMGCSVNFVDPISFSMRSNDAKTLGLLLQHDDVDLSIPKVLQPAIARFFYERGHDVDKYDFLKSAIFYNDVFLFDLLLADESVDSRHSIERGRSSKIRDSYLKLAVRIKDIYMIQRLLDAGGSPCDSDIINGEPSTFTAYREARVALGKNELNSKAILDLLASRLESDLECKKTLRERGDL